MPTALTREVLERAIQSRDDHTPTLAEIVAQFGVSREAVRQRLAKLGLRKKPSCVGLYCVSCGKYLRAGQKRKYAGLCFTCSPVIIIRVLCGQCHTRFDLSERLFRARNKPRKGTMPFFCNKRCLGLWIGTHFGYLAHPENIAAGGWPRLYPGTGSGYQRKKVLGICVLGGCRNPARPGRVRCGPCTAKDNLYRKAWRARRRDQAKTRPAGA